MRSCRTILWVLLPVLTVLAVLSLPQISQAQCSMCRAVTSSNQMSDDAFSIGNGLNNAIIYMMFMPYVLGGIFIYAFFRKQIMAWFRRTLHRGKQHDIQDGAR